MTLKDALNLQVGDTVTIKKTKRISQVVDIEVTPKESTTNKMTCVDVKLDDGSWYGYKEVRRLSNV